MQVLRALWQLIQNEVLGMNWLNRLVGALLTALGLDTGARWVGSVQFFLYDGIKITVLLCGLIFAISYLQSYFPPERSKKILGRFHGVGANVVSALLGTVTPFCACSSIPLFIGFTGAGLPLGVTFSFLISSPMVDLGSLMLLMSVFGAKVAVVYVIIGLVIAVAGAPMYADIFGTIPVAEALLYKGAQLGTILAFMMAVTTLSLPSVILLRKAVKPKLLGLFIGICVVGITIVGYLFNAVQGLLI